MNVKLFILDIRKKTVFIQILLCRVPIDTRFQRAFIQLLCNAQFEELSAADLMLTSALNTDYLLTLPVYVDWKKASESKAIIFRPVLILLIRFWYFSLPFSPLPLNLTCMVSGGDMQLRGRRVY